VKRNTRQNPDGSSRQRKRPRIQCREEIETRRLFTEQEVQDAFSCYLEMHADCFPGTIPVHKSGSYAAAMIVKMNNNGMAPESTRRNPEEE